MMLSDCVHAFFECSRRVCKYSLENGTKQIKATSFAASSSVLTDPMIEAEENGQTFLCCN